jgi:anaerobic ribonucleoside-triphosphate reductase activating protein
MQRESIVDGQGIRMVIWSQGCKMACPGCHNPETHNPCGGKEFDIEELKNEITKYAKYHQGITLSGGDPFLQPEANKELADHAHSLGLDVWAYCGKTYEQLQDNVLLSSCDVLIDGPFVKELRDVTLAFRGSSNQRIINVQRSLESGEVILW